MSPTTSQRDWTRQLWVYPALVIFTGLPYIMAGALHSPFVFDDEKLVRDNESIRDLSRIHEIFDIASKRWDDQPLRANYRPVRFLSYALDYQLSRWYCRWNGISFAPENPPVFIFHLTNLILHGLNVLLLLGIGRRLLGSGAAALALAALFAVHPLATEAVVYISGRRDVLSLFFFLAAVRIYLGREEAPAGRLSWIAFVAVPLLFIAGLLSKEMVVTLPAVLVLIDLARRAPWRLRRAAFHALLFAVAIAFTLFEASNPRLVARPVGGELLGTLLTAPRYVMRYLGLLLFPVSQSLDYSYDAIPAATGLLSPWTTLPALLAVLALWAAGLRALLKPRPLLEPVPKIHPATLQQNWGRLRRRHTALGLLALFLRLIRLRRPPSVSRSARAFGQPSEATPSGCPPPPGARIYATARFSPLSGAFSPGTARRKPSGRGPRSDFRDGLLAIGLLWFLGTLLPVLQFIPIPERFAERFAYLPGIGLFIVLAAGFLRLHRWEPILGRASAAVVSIALLVLCYQRARDWRTPLQLWESAARAQPRCARAHIGHANALRDLGGLRLRDAAAAYSRAIEILEENPRDLQKETLRRGHLLQARLFRAEACAQLGAESPERYRQAIADYRWLLEQADVDGARVAEAPKFTVVYYQLGNCHFGLRELAEARKAYLKVIDRGEPAALVRAAHYYLGKIQLLDGKEAEGVAELEAAYRMAAEEDRRSGDENFVQNRYQLAGELADALIARKDFARAGQVLDEVLEKMGDRPERKHLLFRKARLHDGRAQVHEAALELEKALAIDPRYGPALLFLASLEENRGNLDRAKDLYQKVLEQDPNHDKALRGLDSVELKRALARSSASSPEEEEGLKILDGLIERGEKSIEDGKLKAAEEFFRKAADAPPSPKNQPRRARALLGLGRIAREYRLWDKAEAFFLAAQDADPGSKEALLAAADMRLRDREDGAGARALYRQYVDGFPPGQRGAPHAYFNLALLVEEENPAEAADLLHKAKEAGEKEPAIDRRLGYLYARLEKWEASLDAFQSFLEKAEDPEEKRKVRKYLEEKVLPRVPGGEELRDSKK
ncbi:MAG: tetratricopeptide repeat protein [Planctomycetes bacterium]|nr:tetratricopeptide repeat protein [Planctomycetota bacterium]